MDSPLSGSIREAQDKGVSEANGKIERITISIIVLDIRVLLTRCGQVWVPMSAGVR